MSTVVERDYTPGITRQICFAYNLTAFYMIKGFTERYFLTDYGFRKPLYFVNEPDYYFKPLSRIFCVNSSVIVLSFRSEGPTTHPFCTLLL